MAPHWDNGRLARCGRAALRRGRIESRHLGGGEVITRVVVKKGPLRKFFYVEEATGLYFLKTIYEKETGDQTTRDPITGNDRQSPFAACSLPEFFAGIKMTRKISQTALGLSQ